MLKNIIKEYYINNLENLSSNFSESKIVEDDEIIHKYRLNVKRIKAITTLLDNILDSSILKKKDFQKIKDVYKLSSELRDFQIGEKILKKVDETPSTIISEISKTIIQQREEFKQNKEKFNPEKPIKYLSSFIEHLDENILLESIRKWLNKSISKFEKYEDLHELRRKVKQTFYIVEILHLSGDFTYSDKLPNLKKLSQVLGDWHDIFILLQKIENFKAKLELKDVDELIDVLQNKQIKNLEEINKLRKI